MKIKQVMAGKDAGTVQGRLLVLLRAAPADEVFTVVELAQKLKLAHGYVNGHAVRHPTLAPHRMKLGKACYYGSLKAIAALKEQHTHAQDH